MIAAGTRAARVHFAAACMIVWAVPAAWLAVLHALDAFTPGGARLAAAMAAVVVAQLTFPLRAGTRASWTWLAWPAAVALGAWCAMLAAGAGSIVTALGAAVVALACESLTGLVHARGAARPLAAGATSLLLALAAAAPLWLGPVAELHASRPAVSGLVVGASPLSYLARLAQFDYLRSDWFYVHSALGSLRFTYPEPVPATVAWLAVAGAGAALSRRARRRAGTRAPDPATTTTEDSAS